MGRHPLSARVLCRRDFAHGYTMEFKEVVHSVTGGEITYPTAQRAQTISFRVGEDTHQFGGLGALWNGKASR
ncbi:hypothetical protein CLAIMM_02333 [Cladophialophora immunda]|nr:hypothetical protein CLAIMM_02333 [Cladophialophora immunda]